MHTYLHLGYCIKQEFVSYIYIEWSPKTVLEMDQFFAYDWLVIYQHFHMEHKTLLEYVDIYYQIALLRY